MKAMSNLHDRRIFSVAFNNYSEKNEGAKKLLKEIKQGKYEKNVNGLRKAINAVYIPLVKVASGIHSDIVTPEEYNQLREAVK